MSNWIQTYSGKKFDIDNLTPDMFDIGDIAHALSMLCRYNGHCKEFYSVAEHSVIMANNVDEQYQLHALLHDAAEAYITDVPKPFKQFLKGFDVLENRLMIGIYDYLGLCLPTSEEEKIVKEADLQMLAVEQKQVMGPPPESWNCFGDMKLWEAPVYIQKWYPKKAEDQFLKRFKELYNGTTDIECPGTSASKPRPESTVCDSTNTTPKTDIRNVVVRKRI